MIEGGADGGELEKDSYEEMFRSYLTEDLLEELQKIEQPFVCSEINEKRKTVGPELDKAVTALIKFITGTDKIGVKRIKSLCTDVLCHFDIYVISLMKLTPAIKDVSDEISVWNIFHFLRYLNIPGKKMAGNLFAVEDNPLLFYKKKLKLKRLYQEPWLELIKHELPRPLIRLLVPYLSDHALSGMRDGYLFGDFLFRVFHFGGLFAVLALSGIFKLIMDFNFEYPDFFDVVYGITKPVICHTNYHQKFFSLLDTFLSSTHLPSYVVAAFVKRLCRISLVAPLKCQEPLLALIRNLLTRHEGVRILVHRDEPENVETDPYDENELATKDCGAMNSSIWEIKTMQRHWFLDVAKRANFVEKGDQRVESFVRWKSGEEYFSQIMGKRFGQDLMKHAQEVKYERSQTEDSDSNDEENVDETEGPQSKKRRTVFSKRRTVRSEFIIPTSYQEPKDFFNDDIHFRLKDFWNLNS